MNKYYVRYSVSLYFSECLYEGGDASGVEL